MDNSDDESSDWLSYDSADDSDSNTRARGDDPPAKLVRTPKQPPNCRPNVSSLSPDRQALHPAEPHPSFADPDVSAPGLSALHSDQSIASSLRGSAPSVLDSTFHIDDAPDRNVYLFAPPTPTFILRYSGMDQLSVAEICDRLGSDEDAVRKMAAFKLQSNVGDPSFAEMFILQGGLPKLKYLIMRASGNTLAYSLASFSRLLEVDKGWECVEQDMIGRVQALESPLIESY